MATKGKKEISATEDDLSIELQLFVEALRKRGARVRLVKLEVAQDGDATVVFDYWRY